MKWKIIFVFCHVDHHLITWSLVKGNEVALEQADLLNRYPKAHFGILDPKYLERMENALKLNKEMYGT
jgi:hypothetical protein